MKTYCLWIAVLLLVLAMPAVIFAQVDFINGTDTRTDWRIAGFADDEDGNPAWVREYDGRDLNFIGLESLESLGYGGDYQYWFDARDLFLGNESVDFSLGYKNDFGLELSTDALTHRIDRFPPINPYLAPFGMSDIVAGAPVGDAFLDLTPGDYTLLQRRENGINFRLLPGNSQKVAFIAGWWQETEEGSRQYRFRARATTPGIIGNRVRGAANIPIDRTTDEGILGTDLLLGRNSALNYRFSVSRYDDDGTRPAGGVLATVSPLNTLTRFDSTQTSNVIKGRTKLGQRLYLTGAHTRRTRENDTAAVPAGLFDAGAFLNSEVKIESTNIGLTYLPADAWSLTGRWRRYDLDNRVPPVFADDDGVPEESPENQALSREVESWEIDGTFTGIRRLLLRAGFENRDTERRTNELHPPHEEFEHPILRESTEADIVRLGFRYNPTWDLSLSGKFEDWSIDSAGYAGSPTDRQVINLNATYLLGPNFALYGDFTKWNEENNEVRIPTEDIPTAPIDPVTPEYEDERQLGAGQGYDSDFTTTSIGAWYGITDRLNLNAQFANIQTESGALWILGVDPAFLPHLPPNFVPYEADSDVWSIGLTYALTPRWQVYGRFRNLSADGQSLVDVIPGDPALPSGWQPIDVNEDRWTLGVAFRLSARNRLTLDYSLADWEDEIDPANTGEFNVWRLAWSTGF